VLACVEGFGNLADLCANLAGRRVDDRRLAHSRLTDQARCVRFRGAAGAQSMSLLCAQRERARSRAVRNAACRPVPRSAPGRSTLLTMSTNRTAGGFRRNGPAIDQFGIERAARPRRRPARQVTFAATVFSRCASRPGTARSAGAQCW
jgi:hypothetical protein